MSENKRDPWIWSCDRVFNRDIDPSKILRVTELSEKDFTTVEDGIKHELKKLGSL